MIWNLKQYEDRIALKDQTGRCMSYQELADCGDILIDQMDGRCLVFSLCTNTIGSVLGYTAFINHGIVPVLLSAQLEHELLYNLIETYKPQYIWMPFLQVNEIQLDKYEMIYQSNEYALFRALKPEKHILAGELGLLLTTSGSTGSPKFVKQTYKNIQSNAESIVEYLELDETEKPITTLPMNYTYGLSIINSHLMVGATILLTDDTLMNRNFWKFFSEEAATSFGGVPYTYEILKKLRFFRMELPSLRTMTQAGGKLSPELHKEFAEYAQEQGKHFVVMYGQTEATARMAYLPYDKALEKYGSMGIAIPGGKLWLRDTMGNEITVPEVVGELVYEGPNVTMGYAQCIEDLAVGDERNGILETGDMAKRDADGYYYIVGRLKRFLKIFGNRVNLDEMERMVKSAFAEFDCACTGMDDKLYVFITKDDEDVMNEVKKYLTVKTKLNSSAFTVKYIDEIPKNDAGKVQYRLLEEYYD